MNEEKSLRSGNESPFDLPRLRDQAMDLLTEAFANGTLSLEEYERRAGLIQKAMLPSEITGQIAGLPRSTANERRTLRREPKPGLPGLRDPCPTGSS